MNTTDKLKLRMPAEEDYADVADLNYNAQVIDREVSKRIQTVNGVAPNDEGAVLIDEVPFARQLATDDDQKSTGEFIERTTGGSASLTDGDATLVSLFGRRVHTGYSSESLNMTVTPVAREEGEETITAEIDRNTFVNYVQNSGTTTLTFTDAWSANPSLYGVTVTGTPLAGDRIVIVYVKEERGTITMSNPTAFRSTGWNLYNNTLGYAKVIKYSNEFGFMIGGTYAAVKFSATEFGAKTTISPVGGYFTIPSDGYIWVTGGNETDTYVLMTWSDWQNGYEGDFMPYSEQVIDLSGVMTTYFPYGLGHVGGISDEINLSMNRAIRRIDRMEYTTANLETIIATGRPYECDANYIYYVREAEIVTDGIGVSGAYAAYDHGMEYIDGTEVPVYIQTLYGQNLVDYLRHDVPEQLEKLNNSTDALRDGLAIVANGNTHPAIAQGQYVYVKNHTTLAEGLYKARSAIGASDTLSTSNLEADSAGGLNAVKESVDTLNSNLAHKLSAIVMAQGVTSISANSYVDVTFSYTLPVGATYIDSVPYLAGQSTSPDYGSINCNRYSASATQTIVRVFAGAITQPRAPGVRLVILYTA